MSFKYTMFAILLGLATASTAAQADPFIFESFTGYPDDALISAIPPGRRWV